MTEFLVGALIVLLVPALIGWWLGYRQGVRRTKANIAEVLQGTRWFDQSKREPMRPNRSSDEAWHRIAESLYFTGYEAGQEDESRISAPKSDETALIMSTKDLQTVAWLSGLGFRAWVDRDPTDDLFERPSFDEAERTANTLEIFERRIVPNLLAEEPDDKEHRFTTSYNRMTSLWQRYGKLT